VKSIESDDERWTMVVWWPMVRVKWRGFCVRWTFYYFTRVLVPVSPLFSYVKDDYKFFGHLFVHCSFFVFYFFHIMPFFSFDDPLIVEFFYLSFWCCTWWSIKFKQTYYVSQIHQSIKEVISNNANKKNKRKIKELHLK
jgi:hypothetical protein